MKDVWLELQSVELSDDSEPERIDVWECGHDDDWEFMEDFANRLRHRAPKAAKVILDALKVARGLKQAEEGGGS